MEPPTCIQTSSRRRRRRPRWGAGALLTVLLVFTGGPLNPFTFLYLVHVSLATIVLSAPWAWTLTVLAAGAYFGLFVAEDFTPPHDHAHMTLHLKGMWVAFSVAALFITYFVARVRQALDDHARDQVALRVLRDRSERLSALATLAGGAAHELSTPLATISLVASELVTRLERASDSEFLVTDMRLVLGQVERCRHVLMQLAADGGAVLGEAARVVTVDNLVADVVAQLAAGSVSTQLGGAGEAKVEVPPRAFALALRGLVKNALEAGSTTVSMVASVTADHVVITVVDDGSGMSPEVLRRLGEPFFTTKGPERGMGLGVFLARTLTERLGGELKAESATTAAGQERRGTRLSLC